MESIMKAAFDTTAQQLMQQFDFYAANTSSTEAATAAQSAQSTELQQQQTNAYQYQQHATNTSPTYHMSQLANNFRQSSPTYNNNNNSSMLAETQQQQLLLQQLQHSTISTNTDTRTNSSSASTSPISMHSLNRDSKRSCSSSSSTSSNNNYNNNNNNKHNFAYSVFHNNYAQQQQQQQQPQQHPQHLQHSQHLEFAQTNYNLNNTQHHSYNQMELQQQQQQPPPQQQQPQQLPLSHNASPNVTPGASTPPPAVATQQQQQQQQQHLQLGNDVAATGTASATYKTASSSSCWCYGESVCSGNEVEIENNNNNHVHHGDSTYHMKILVPAVASGAIIGKGGETIASLQKDTGARVKMSKSRDFYPGTSERVCLITGSIDGIMTVLDFIMDKIRDKPDLTTKIIDAESKQAQERDKQVKILVPNSTAGMIIGKGGAFIKQIKEESGSYVQISQKPKDVSLQERCITIIGDKENNKNACKMILSKIVEDPQSGTCLNVSYADVSGPVANFNPTGSPYATNQNAINTSTASLNSTLGASMGGGASAPSLLVNGTGINLSLNLAAPNPTPNLAVANQLLEHIKIAMRGSGYTESATNEVCAALGVLAKYGVLAMGVGVPHANGAHPTLGNYLGVTTLDQQSAAAASAATAGNVFGAVGQVSMDQYAAAAAVVAASRPTQTQLEAAAAQFDAFRHLNQAAAPNSTPVSLNNNSFGLTAATGTATTAQLTAASLSGLSKSPTPGDLGAKDSKIVEIPEVIIGAVLGPNGRSLVEIQHISGANVQISKKGIFTPGTRNRIVTITGQPSAIAKAQYLIEQKINEEETKRARQIPLTTVVN